MTESRLRFALSRDVQLPTRAGKNEAGIDFFIPKDLTVEDIVKANEKVSDINIYHGTADWPSAGTICLHTNDANGDGYITEILFGAGSRLIIPSGVHALIEPWDSALIAANKSGVSTKKGIVFIHTPILLTKVEQISWDGYDGFLSCSEGWSERGNNWQGSTDIEPYNDGPDA